ncbi:hypothetical protein BY996DRAFT_6454660 [Phakopsora pachyrhizi]|nr:hypothetical protein BY996DRAFT_6454660 [Phakopsora pachyrhizi]
MKVENKKKMIRFRYFAVWPKLDLQSKINQIFNSIAKDRAVMNLDLLNQLNSLNRFTFVPHITLLHINQIKRALGKPLHVTVGTIDESIRPIEGKLLLENVVGILKEDDLQPPTTTVPIASTLTNPVVENQQRGLNDQPTEKGGDKPVVGLKDSMDQGNTPRNLDGDRVNAVLIDSSNEDPDLRERVESDLIDLNQLPLFFLWESRSVPWFPILPINICLWLDSVKPAVEIEDVRMILRELEENREVFCKGSSRICESEAWRSFCEYRGFETDQLFWINGDNKGVDEKKEGFLRAERDNSDGISRAIKQSTWELLFELRSHNM